MLRLTDNAVPLKWHPLLRHRMVNLIAVFRQGINAICVGLLIVANMEFGNPFEKAMETAAGIAAFALLVFGEKF